MTTPFPAAASPSPDTAEGWLARLNSPDCDADDFAAFEEWLAASPLNVTAYAEAERLHAMARRSMIESASTTGPGSHAGPSSTKNRPRRHRTALLQWAAALVLALGTTIGGWIALRPPPPERYATVVGKQLTLSLADGSRLTLDTDTQVAVAYSPDRRSIELLRGRVQAVVAPNRDRPFVVRSEEGAVRAVGTVFQVERHAGRTLVKLLEGHVIVAPAMAAQAIKLDPLQQVDYGADGRASPVKALDLAEAEGWTQGRLVFKERRLGDLLLEVNRYSPDRLILATPELADIRISGAFDADDRSALLAALQQGWGLHARHTGRNQTMLYRQD